uniref:Uncharacterized protein n=1 Tax=viral metagenome TaxID=1070528 RepID=A0A6C0DGH5_9ZZZZ
MNKMIFLFKIEMGNEHPSFFKLFNLYNNINIKRIQYINGK